MGKIIGKQLATSSEYLAFLRRPPYVEGKAGHSDVVVSASPAQAKANNEELVASCSPPLYTPASICHPNPWNPNQSLSSTSARNTRSSLRAVSVNRTSSPSYFPAPPR